MSAVPELTDVALAVAAKHRLADVTFCGKGAFKETFSANGANGVLALKLIDRTKIDLDRTEREISALKRCKSQRIAKIFETFVFTASDGRLFDVVLEEFFDGGSLEDRLKTKKLDVSEVIDLARGLARAVRDLFPLQLVHRDIKPANVMFRQGSNEPVLVDFGLVRDLNESSLTATWLPHGPGTPFYSSPEQLNNDKGLIDWRSDQFSIGVLIAVLLTERHPYQVDAANANAAIYATLQRKGPAEEFQTTMTKMGLDHVVKMLRPWPVQRVANPDAFVNSFTR